MREITNTDKSKFTVLEVIARNPGIKKKELKEKSKIKNVNTFNRTVNFLLYIRAIRQEKEQHGQIPHLKHYPEDVGINILHNIGIGVKKPNIQIIDTRSNQSFIDTEAELNIIPISTTDKFYEYIKTMEELGGFSVVVEDECGNQINGYQEIVTKAFDFGNTTDLHHQRALLIKLLLSIRRFGVPEVLRIHGGLYSLLFEFVERAREVDFEDLYSWDEYNDWLIGRVV